MAGAPYADETHSAELRQFTDAIRPDRARRMFSGGRMLLVGPPVAADWLELTATSGGDSPGSRFRKALEIDPEAAMGGGAPGTR